MSYDPREQDELIVEFVSMLRLATGDGGKKRAAGTKPSWKVDPSHEAALFSHLNKWKHGELLDRDSGAHPLVHLAWRALAIAWQETQFDTALTWGPTEAELIEALKLRNCLCCAAQQDVIPDDEDDPAYD